MMKARALCSVMCWIVVGCGTTDEIPPHVGGLPGTDSGAGRRDAGVAADSGGVLDAEAVVDAGSEACAPAPRETVTVSAGPLFLANNRFSPDSSSLAVVAFEGFASQGLRIVDLCGALVSDIGNDDGPRAAVAWSNDAASLFYGSSDGAKSVSAAGGTPQILVADSDEFDVSPDGAMLVYSDNGDLFTWDIANSTATDLMVEGNFPRFSPDGTQVAFVEGGMLQFLTLGSTSVAAVGPIESAAFQPFDWLTSDSFAVVTATGIEAAVSDGGGGYTRTTVVNGSAIQDVDVSPDGAMISYRINLMRPVYVYGAAQRKTSSNR